MECFASGTLQRYLRIIADINEPTSKQHTDMATKRLVTLISKEFAGFICKSLYLMDNDIPSSFWSAIDTINDVSLDDISGCPLELRQKLKKK